MSIIRQARTWYNTTKGYCQAIGGESYIAQLPTPQQTEDNVVFIGPKTLNLHMKMNLQTDAWQFR